MCCIKKNNRPWQYFINEKSNMLCNIGLCSDEVLKLCNFMCDVDTENLSDRNYDILSWLCIEAIKENFLVVFLIK